VVGLTTLPGEHQIRNSNSYSLAAQVARAGAIPEILPVAPDRYAETRDLILRGLEADLLLLSGGVSAGKYDIVEQVLGDLGAEFFFTRVRIQPGQPAVFGRARNKFFFGLPGNPASTMVTFEIFARAAIDLLSGQPDSVLPVLDARLAAPFSQKGGLTRFLPAYLNAHGLTPIAWKGSGDVASMARANCLLVSDPHRESYASGDPIGALVV
jgi:molybdopterin molybdotransferase